MCFDSSTAEPRRSNTWHTSCVTCTVCIDRTATLSFWTFVLSRGGGAPGACCLHNLHTAWPVLINGWKCHCVICPVIGRTHAAYHKVEHAALAFVFICNNRFSGWFLTPLRPQILPVAAAVMEPAPCSLMRKSDFLKYVFGIRESSTCPWVIRQNFKCVGQRTSGNMNSKEAKRNGRCGEGLIGGRTRGKEVDGLRGAEEEESEI